MQLKSMKRLISSRPLCMTTALCVVVAIALASAGNVRASEEMPPSQEEDGVFVEDAQEEAPIGSETAAEEELQYESPSYDPSKFYFVDHFDNIEESRKRWIKSQAKKDDIAEEIAKYDGQWSWEPPQRIVWKKDIGLVLKSKAKHSAIAARLQKEFKFEEKPLVVQYEVTMQNGQECGGSYIKLLSSGKATDDLTKFNDKTPYTIMFGPDKCGNDHKLHFIFRHVNPINGSVEEKHCKKPKDRLEEPFKDKLPHLYRLIVNPDNTFEIRVDNKIINEGSLLTEFTPPVNPPREIDDPNDKKPENWDEREKIPDPLSQKPEDWDDDAPPQIPDPTAVKPEDWLEDEPDMIPDPSAVKPEDWDAEIDGEWEAPLVDNPICEKVSGCGSWKAPLVPNKEYKGKWRAPMIDNPNYQGKWAPRKIPNPDYFEDSNPFAMTAISAIGIELWSMSDDILFDNLFITDDVEVADEFTAKTFDLKRKFIDKESSSFWNKIQAYADENPWAWKVVLMVAAVFISAYMYTYTSKLKKKNEENAKKTDAIQPDDPQSEGGESLDAKKSPSGASRKQRKSDLDVKEGDAASGVRQEQSPKAAVNEEEQQQEDEIEEDNEDNEEETESAIDKPAPRKRRVRKDES